MSKYYTLDRIKKVDAQFKILLGGRNIGKSYATKHDVLKECYQSGKEFIYLRRWDRDIKTQNVLNYFADVDVSGITDGKYTNIDVFHGVIYFHNVDEDGKKTDKLTLGYAHALNLNERYKSQIFPRVIYIIYEEFITDEGYLPDECNKLQNYVSTIFRERSGVVYMVGNTISKLCPYFNEWRLEKVTKMKTHEIALFENSTEVLTPDGNIVILVKIAVEMCGAQSVLSKMAFGDSANMIVKNTWQSKTVAKIDDKVRDESEEIYTLFVYCDNLCFRLSLMIYNNMAFWYVTPQTKAIKNEEETRIISDKPSINPLHTNNFTALSDKEKVAFGLIKQNKIFYCSNSCGTDFQQVLKKYHVLFI